MPQDQVYRLPLARNTTGQGLILTTLAMLAVGVVMVPSALATVSDLGPWYARVSVKHLFFAPLAAVVVLTCWRADLSVLAWGKRVPILATMLLVVSLALGALVFVPGVGKSVGGQFRWIVLGPITFQPSELMKLALVIFLSAYLTRREVDPRSFLRGFLIPLLVVGVCIGMVVTEDLGTAVVMVVTSGITMLVAGVKVRYLGTLALAGAGGFWAMLAASPSRMQRITAIIDPTAVDNPSTFQLRQSLITIQSGGYNGKGLGLGMMKLGFLPEDSTDFLFAVLCEEWGAVGAGVLLALLAAYLLFARQASVRCASRFGKVLAASLGFLIVLQATMHIAVNLGCLPPTGMAMPFISAGGTSLLLMAGASALIVSASALRPAGEVDRCPDPAPGVSQAGPVPAERVGPA